MIKSSIFSAAAVVCGLATAAFGSSFVSHTASMRITPGMSAELKAHIKEHEAAHANMDNSYMDSLKPLMKNCKAPGKDARYEWPTTIESIGHSISSYQNYTGKGRFHHGVDFRAPANVDIISPFRGQVAMIRNYMAGELYWEVAVLDPTGCLWQYHHIAQPSIPQQIKDAFEAFKKDNTNGGFIEKGTKVGQIVPWPVETYGELFHHIHLNILDGNKAYLNGYNFMKELPDNQAPVIKRIGLMKGVRIQDTTTVSGDYKVFAEVSDLIMHDKFILPPYSLSYYFKDKPGEVHPVWTFETLPGKDDYSAKVHDYFLYSGLRGELTCGNYECRRFFVNIGFQKKMPETPGTYSIVVVAKDNVGNTTEKPFTWTVK